MLPKKIKHQLIAIGLYLLSISILVWVDWRVAVGVIIFVTALNIENKYKKLT